MTPPARTRWHAETGDEAGVRLGLRANLSQFMLLAVVNFFVGGMDGRAVLDVRQDAEYRAGHVPGAAHIELGDLRGRAQDVPREAVVMCGHGERAMTAASMLQRAGHHGLSVLAGGAQEWATVTGRPLQEGT